MNTTENEVLNESWIPGFGRKYSIISTGIVYTHSKSGRSVLSTATRTFSGKTEEYVQLYHKGRRHVLPVRTCLAMAFLNAKKDDRTYWLDGDPTNIRLSNVGHKKRKVSSGTQTYKVLTKIFGYDLGSRILERYLRGEDVREWINKKYATDGFDPDVVGNDLDDTTQHQEHKGGQTKRRGRKPHINQTPYQIKSSERWVPGFEPYYLVDKAGRVFGVDRNGKRDFLPLVTTGNVWGKPKVKMVHPKTRQTYSKPLSLVVAAAWLGAIQGDKIEFVDGDMYNCAVENLNVIRTSNRINKILISAVHMDPNLLMPHPSTSANKTADVVTNLGKPMGEAGIEDSDVFQITTTNLTETQVLKSGAGKDISKMKLTIKDGSIMDAKSGYVIATKLQMEALLYLYRKYPEQISTISDLVMVDEKVCIDLVNTLLSQTPTPNPDKDLSLKNFLARILSSLSE